MRYWNSIFMFQPRIELYLCLHTNLGIQNKWKIHQLIRKLYLQMLHTHRQQQQRKQQSIQCSGIYARVSCTKWEKKWIRKQCDWLNKYWSSAAHMSNQFFGFCFLHVFALIIHGRVCVWVSVCVWWAYIKHMF